MSAMKEESAKQSQFMLSWLWQHCRWKMLLTIVAGIAGGLADIALINVINTALHEQHRRAELSMIFVGLVIAHLFLHACASIFPAQMAKYTATWMRRALYTSILGAQLQEVEKRGAANLLTLFTSDVPTVTSTLVIMPKILMCGAICVFGAIYIAYLSIPAFVILVVMTLVGVFLYEHFSRMGTSLLAQMRDELALLNENYHGLIFGLKQLKLNRRRRRHFSRANLNHTSIKAARLEYSAAIFAHGGEGIGQATFYALIALMLFLTPAFQALDSIDLSACVLIVIYIIGPLSALVEMIPVMSKGIVAWKQLSQAHVFDNAAGGVAEGTVSPPSVGWNHIELRNLVVDFGHSNKQFQLGPLNAKFQRGEVTYIVGANGSGKSTLVKALLGLYVPQEGAVLLDGEVVDSAAMPAYQELFSATFPDSYLFTRIIGPMGKDMSPMAEKYLSVLDLANHVRVRRSQLKVLGGLSTGQRNRLTLLSAYLEDRSVYIFDEWAAAQDPVFRTFFYEVLLKELKQNGKCVIVISHDQAFFSFADRIITMDSGRIQSDIRLASNVLEYAL